MTIEEKCNKKVSLIVELLSDKERIGIDELIILKDNVVVEYITLCKKTDNLYFLRFKPRHGVPYHIKYENGSIYYELCTTISQTTILEMLEKTVNYIYENDKKIIQTYEQMDN